MLLHTDVADRGLDLLTATDFFRHSHRQIFAAMARLREDGASVEFVTLCHDLERHKELDDAGGRSYIAALVDGVPKGSNIAHYAEIVKETRRRRDLIKYGARVTTEAYFGQMDSRALLGEADRWLGELSGLAAHSDLVDQAAAMTAFLDDLERRIERKHELLGLTTGFPSLDDMTCGLIPGEFTILAAGTGGGKTALLLNIAMAAAVQPHAGAVMVSSLEMSRQQLMYRIASARAKVELFKIRKGLLTPAERERVALAMMETARWPLYVDDTSSMTIHDIRARARRLAADGKLALLGVDYIQLVTGDLGRKHENRTTEVGEIGRGLKLLARELGVPVVALSQLSRDSAKQKRKPQLHDLRESGALEQHADNVWFLHEGEKTELIIGKQRQGPVGAVDMFFDKAVCTFHDTAAEEKDNLKPTTQTTLGTDW